ncbi:MAG: GNAT family N-acetyltransferase [Rikenellaceae bacterium]
MLKRVKIETEQSIYFDSCFELYTSAFPREERRSKEYHLETMRRDKFSFDAVLDDDKFVGIVAWWDFDQIRYIEHFAVCPTLRGGGYGAKILKMFGSESQKTILLEVEYPENDQLKMRRIEFYKRQGFVLNPHPYSHPPYVGDSLVNLLIMTSPSEITAETMEAFKTNYFPLIHFRESDKE